MASAQKCFEVHAQAEYGAPVLRSEDEAFVHWVWELCSWFSALVVGFSFRFERSVWMWHEHGLLSCTYPEDLDELQIRSLQLSISLKTT